MRATRAAKGHVYLVGAGPGDPELLTLKAVRLIESADVILHDDLVAQEVLALAGPQSSITSVGKRCGRPRITQAGIHRSMIEAAQAGQSVVRLKSGDPLIFGRAGEELAALKAAQVPCEIVPGITAALAAGASLQLPLTDRRFSSKLIFVTGHHAAAGDRENSPLWDGRLPADVTLAIYMPGRELGPLQQSLEAAGLAGQTPCAAISEAATERQGYVACPLAKLGELACGPTPLLIVVGEAVRSLMPHEQVSSLETSSWESVTF